MTPSAPAEVHPAPSHDEEHHGPTVKMYFVIFLALAILTVVTVLAARFDFTPLLGAQMGGFANNVIALGIATTKASLVVLFFMHVKYENKLVGLAVVASVVWLAFLILIILSDYLTRTGDWHLLTR